jgi:hypothetical protein
MDAGRAEPLLQRPDITLPYLTNTWLTNMRDFMEHHNLQIERSNKWSMRLQCEKDTMLMEYFVSRRVSINHHLNACQMFLQMLSILDIATADGVQLCQIVCLIANVSSPDDLLSGGQINLNPADSTKTGLERDSD